MKMENKRPYNKKRNFNKKKENTDGVVYRTKSTGPEKKADWQLKLMAISYVMDKMSMSDNDFNDAVEKRYVDLLLKQK